MKKYGAFEVNFHAPMNAERDFSALKRARRVRNPRFISAMARKFPVLFWTSGIWPSPLFGAEIG
jgi:hypothetical protein